MITYRIDATDVRAHLFRVTLTVPAPAAEQRLSLPVWIPGSYLVREFARHLSSLVARQGGREVPVRQLDKATWLVAHRRPGELTIGYDVYAFDTSVRAAFLDAGRGFFNGTSLFLKVDGAESGAAPRRAAGAARGMAGRDHAARASTSMAPGAASTRPPTTTSSSITRSSSGASGAAPSRAGGVPHEFVVAGALPDFDGERLLADSARICAAQIAFWHGAAAAAVRALPVPAQRGRGRPRRARAPRQHGADRAAPRPAAQGRPGRQERRAERRLRQPARPDQPRILPRLERQAPDARASSSATTTSARTTPSLLWFFEGFTSYYDDLFLLRSGLIDEARYLKLLSRTLTNVLATPGRLAQSVAQASFDAWVKYYRQRREHAERDDQLLREGRAGRARARPDACGPAAAARSTTSCARSGRRAAAA